MTLPKLSRLVFCSLLLAAQSFLGSRYVSVLALEDAPAEVCDPRTGWIKDALDQRKTYDDLKKIPR